MYTRAYCKSSVYVAEDTQANKYLKKVAELRVPHVTLSWECIDQVDKKVDQEVWYIYSLIDDPPKHMGGRFFIEKSVYGL